MAGGVYKRTKAHGRAISKARQGSINWSRGLTKEIDTRVANNAKSIQKSIKELWKDPAYVAKRNAGYAKFRKERGAEVAAKISRTLTGRKTGPQSKELIEKRMRGVLKALCKHPNKFEANSMNYVNTIYGGNVRFTGDGSLIINGKSADAVLDGTNIVFLFNGVYWHLERFGYAVTEEAKRIVEAKESTPFLQAGYKVIFVWEDELNRVIKKCNKKV